MRIQRIQQKKQPLEASGVDLKPLEKLTESFKGKKGIMIPLLQGIQEVYGYLPYETFLYVSKALNIRLSEMYGVATFYAQFRLHPVGKHIVKVCHGTACHVQNAKAISDALLEALNIEDGGTTEDGLFTVESVACLGCCSLAPVMMIGEETYGKLKGSDAVKIVKEIKLKETKKS